MHDGHQRVPEHLFLPEGQQQYIFPPSPLLAGIGFILSQQDIASDPFDLFGKQEDSNSQCQDKKRSVGKGP